MKWFFILCSALAFSSEVPNFKDLSKTEGSVIFLSTRHSGSNLVSGSLSAITRKPISWLIWGDAIFSQRGSRYRAHPSYNRLKLPLASDQPLLYRSHNDFDKLMRIPAQQNKLIFVTRNPKELLLKSFFSSFPETDSPDAEFIARFLIEYMGAFEVYNAWHPENRLLIFYEDFIQGEDAMLLNILKFMDESPLYFDDFIMNKEEYKSKLLESYKEQHKRRKLVGASSSGGPQPLFYSNKTTPETLQFLDESLERASPLIWEKYLKRFSSDGQKSSK